MPDAPKFKVKLEYPLKHKFSFISTLPKSDRNFSLLPKIDLIVSLMSRSEGCDFECGNPPLWLVPIVPNFYLAFWPSSSRQRGS